MTRVPSMPLADVAEEHVGLVPACQDDVEPLEQLLLQLGSCEGAKQHNDIYSVR